MLFNVNINVSRVTYYFVLRYKVSAARASHRGGKRTKSVYSVSGAHSLFITWTNIAI